MRTIGLLPLLSCVALATAGSGVPRRSPLQAPQLVNGQPLSDQLRGSTPQGAWVFYELYVPTASTSLTVDLYGLTGDADLYVRRLDPPTLSSFDCRPYLTGTTQEHCAFTNPGAGLYWVGVNNYDTGPVSYTLRATWTCASGGCNVLSLQNGLPIADSITSPTPQAGWNDYYVAVPPGGTDLVVDLYNLTGDVDLYLGRIDAPTLTSFTCRSDSGGNAAEQCSVPIPSSGLWWVSVNNYDTGTINYTARASWEIRSPVGRFQSDTMVGSAPQAAWNDTYLMVPPGATSLQVDLTDLTGDADLYLRRIDKPTLSLYDCRPLVNGIGSEQCTIASPQPGLWWLSVNNYDTGPLHYDLRATLACGGGPCHPAQGILVGLGPGAGSPPSSAWVAYDPVAGAYDSGVAPYSHYGTLQAGVNVGGAYLDATLPGTYLTGPGNVAVFGPHVRGWSILGAPYTRVNFFAYGTLRFGVKVRGMQADADALDEILTGAGQGAVFGPHVRGWNFDNGTVQATPISFFAYASYRYGVNVEAADMDGAGHDEVLTAPVFGSGYTTNVRGWSVDVTRNVIAIPSINFYAFTNPNDHGCTLAAGDVDGDGQGEILAGRGPAPGMAANVAGFTWDGANVYTYPQLDFVAFGAYAYGTNVTMPDLDGGGTSEVVAASGPAPTAPPMLRAFSFAGGTLAPIAGLDGLNPFAGDFPAAREGATLGVGSR